VACAGLACKLDGLAYGPRGLVCLPLAPAHRQAGAGERAGRLESLRRFACLHCCEYRTNRHSAQRLPGARENAPLSPCGNVCACYAENAPARARYRVAKRARDRPRARPKMPLSKNGGICARSPPYPLGAGASANARQRPPLYGGGAALCDRMRAHRREHSKRKRAQPPETVRLISPSAWWRCCDFLIVMP
jgi:hypothetical protein